MSVVSATAFTTEQLSWYRSKIIAGLQSWHRLVSVGSVIMIKFVTLKNLFCKVCKIVVMHEYGMDTETKIEYKQCLACETLTEVKSERQQDHITPHYSSQSYKERSEDT